MAPSSSLVLVFRFAHAPCHSHWGAEDLIGCPNCKCPPVLPLADWRTIMIITVIIAVIITMIITIIVAARGQLRNKKGDRVFLALLGVGPTRALPNHTILNRGSARMGAVR